MDNIDFREYLRKRINTSNSIIEFGPLNRPLFKKSEFKHIFYADVRSTEEIKKLYTGNDYLTKTGISIDINSIVDVDYKICNSYKETFKSKKFDIAYLSHVIEHIPDIINFFQEIYDVINDDGHLIIIYPDKRYCFDHFRNEISFRDAYATNKYGVKENARMAFDFSYNVVAENDAEKFWKGNCLEYVSHSSLSEAEEYYNKIKNGETIEDVHFWPFSDYGFLKFVFEMQRAGLLNFEIEEFYPTQQNTQEFLVIFKKCSSINDEIIKKTIELLDRYEEISITRYYYNELLGNTEKMLQIEEELNAARLILKQNEGELEKLKAAERKLTQEVENIYNSSSMKLTKPLRQLRKFFGGKKNE